MPSNNPIIEYLGAIHNALQTGNATEHTYRPALKTLLESLAPGVTATNEPKRVECGAPDYVLTRKSKHGPLTVGYIEAKDIGKLTPDIERTDQMKRYLSALPNLLLTDYLEFRWFVNGARRDVARLSGTPEGSKLQRDAGAEAAVARLLDNFLQHKVEPIRSPQELALRMARLTHLIRDIIIEAFKRGEASPLLKGWRSAFAQVLITDLDQPYIEKVVEFADMFAQTLAYGLFSARIMDRSPESFTRQEAQYLIPKTNPFLRRFFYEISGPDLDDEPYADFVNDLAALLADTDMDAVLSDFGKRTRQEDPVVHFYETFLAAYDPKLRESRGVYYTPEPVVQYIVRSVDHLLKTRFGLKDGLADAGKVTVTNTDPSLMVKGTNEMRKTMEVPRVLVLDPACGTGTFQYAVVDLIREQFKKSGNAGMWSDYVRNGLLPRLFGFELLMAPYAVAHFKLGLQLAGRDLPPEERDTWAYDFATDERLGIYLTNTLEGPHEYTGLPLFTQFLANETQAANQVKRDLPIMVVMGNPPYSGHSANKGQWIIDLLRGKDVETGKPTGNYFEVDGQPLGEKNPKWLNDDYVKFIRFAQWRIDRTGSGILAFISNNGYLDNPTFRGMRQALMHSFTDIYMLNLHGSSKKGERSPDGSPDQNVFDIQQGVAIGIFVKEAGKSGPARMHHADLWGLRDTKNGHIGKYPWLLSHDTSDTEWRQLNPKAPFYLFLPQNVDRLAEYEQGIKVTDIFPVNSVGIATARDALTIHWSEDDVWRTVVDFARLPAEDARAKYKLGNDARDWKVSLAQADLKESGPSESRVVPIYYRPLDVRHTYFTGKSRGFHCMPRGGVMRNILAGPNISLITSRLTKGEMFAHAQVTRHVTEVICMSPKTSNNGFVFPLYLYPDRNSVTLFDMDSLNASHTGRRPNLAEQYISSFSARLGMRFLSEGTIDLLTSFGPEAVFNYIYAILHSPTYRERYADFLRMDFPRVPLTSNVVLFRKLCQLGGELVALHLMDERGPTIAAYPVKGSNKVEALRYVPPTPEAAGRVYINKTQYFEGVPPEVWEFHIGGYQVAEKWLKDRKGRVLTFEELQRYRDVVGALAETIRLMGEIDAAIPGWPIE